jgi:hypothetical protein
VKLCGIKGFSLENRIGRILFLLFYLTISISISLVIFSTIKWEKEKDFIISKTNQIDTFQNNFASKRFYHEFGKTTEQVESDFMELDFCGILCNTVLAKDSKSKKETLTTMLRTIRYKIENGENYVDPVVFHELNVFAKLLDEKDEKWDFREDYSSRREFSIYLYRYYVKLWNAGAPKLLTEQNINAYNTSAYRTMVSLDLLFRNFLEAADAHAAIERTYGIEAYEQQEKFNSNNGTTQNNSTVLETKYYLAEYTETFKDLYMYSQHIDPFAIKSNLIQAKDELLKRDSKTDNKFILELAILLVSNLFIVIFLRVFNWVRG